MAAVGTSFEMIFYRAEAVSCEYIMVYSWCVGDVPSVPEAPAAPIAGVDFA